jgi:heme/copper-type cytochrome/quinol oxidase subunit 1
MPGLSRWYIRSALLYLLLGFTLGGFLLVQKGLSLDSRIWIVLPVHIEFMLMGWTLQFVMGMAFWILPRLRGSRGDERVVWWAFWLLNLGVILVCVGSVGLVSAEIQLLGRVIETSSGLAFVFHVWPRLIKIVGA